MSSHHIVREKQEPALLVLSLDGFSEEMLGQLLEWSPTVITTPLTAEHINALGIKVDMVIANELDTRLQSDIKLIPAGKGTVVETALDFLLKNDYTAVNIINGDVQINDFLFYADKINLVIFTNNLKIYPVTSGFSKWSPAGEHLQLLSTTGGLHTNGLRQTDDHNYITTNDGFFSLQFNAPFLLIAQEI